MQHFIYVYSEADRQILAEAGLPLLQSGSGSRSPAPYVFLVNGIAGERDVEALMSRLSKTATLSNRMFFAGVIPHPAGHRAQVQEV